MTLQHLSSGHTHQLIQAAIAKYENQTGLEAVAELEAAINAGQAFVNIQVPVSKLSEIRRLLAKPVSKAEPDEVRKVAERRKRYPSQPKSIS